MSVFHAITRIVVKHCSHFRFQPDRIQLPRVCYRLTVTCAPFSFFFRPPSQMARSFVFDERSARVYHNDLQKTLQVM